MADIVKGDEAKITKEKDGYLITSKVVYPNNKNFVKEEMMFDKKAKVQWLQIFNKDNSPELKIVFNKVQYNGKLGKNYFKAPSKLEAKTSSSTITDADLPLYPMEIFESKLSGKSVMDIEGESRHVLEYTGDKNFTVVERIAKAPNETQTVLMPGRMVDMLDLVGFYDGNRMSVVENGIDLLLTAGKLAGQIVRYVQEYGDKTQAIAYADKEALLADLDQHIKKGDTILIKASHFMNFTEIVKVITE